MCLSCKSKKDKVWSFVENRMTGYPIKFDHNEVEELRRKFKKISMNREMINKITFQENMGILGLQSVFGFSDRLFNSFDIDNDGYISFQDFLQYMEVLKCGSEKNKAKISFRLIDIKNKDRVNIEEFKEFLADYFNSWTSITNSIITTEIKERTDQYVNYIFKKVKKDTKKDTIDFRYYAEKMYGDKQFMDAFQFITEGVANVFMSDQITQNDSMILFKIINKIRQIYSSLGDFNFSGDESPRVQKFMRSEAFKNRESQIYQNAMDEKPVIEQQCYPSVSPSNKTNQVFSKSKNKKGIFSSRKQEASSTFASGPNAKNTTTTHSFRRENQLNFGQESFQEPFHKCHSCYNMIVVEKKLNFIAGKLKDLIDETEAVYDRLYDKFVESVNQANKKKDTVGNIHRQSSIPKQNMIFIGDDNWNLVLNMMIGIQMAVRSVKGFQQMIYEEPQDFNLKYYFELVPRRFGGQKYISRICSFTDYAPNTFNHIRKIFKIDNEEYINSIGPKKLMASLMMGQVNSLTALTSQGKSGSFFYYTADGKYMLKTIQYREYKYLREILQDYYHYLVENPQTLITKFFGLHKLIEKDDKGDVIGKSYFVIMGNVFNTKEKIIERYDLKGSWYGRQTKDQRPGITKKDNDFKSSVKNGLNIESFERQRLVTIIRKDSQFFRSHNIIDYSLLIGIIRKQPSEQSIHKMDEEYSLHLKDRQTKIYEEQNGQECYIFGIIDILTEYNSRKAMQYYFKKIIYGEGISAVPPDEYADRFFNFIESNVFKQRKQLKLR